jgi:hypothetical protein
MRPTQRSTMARLVGVLIQVNMRTSPKV